VRSEGLGTSLLGGAAAMMVIRVLSMGIVFGLHFGLARILGPAEYGHYSYAAAWLAALQVVAAFGLNDTSIRLLSAYRAAAEWSLLKGFLRASGAALFVSSIFVASVFAVGVFVQGDRLDESSRYALYLVALATPAVAFAAIWTARLRGLKKVFESAIPMDLLLPIVFGIVFLVGTAVRADRPLGGDAMWANAIAAAAAFVVCHFLFRRSLPEATRGVEPEYAWSEWLRLAGPLMAMSLLVMVRARSATLLVGSYEEAEWVGYFASSSRIAQLTTFGASAIGVWSAPFISELHARGDRAGLQRLAMTATRGSVGLMLPVGVIIYFFGSEILGLFGNEFRVGYVTLLILTGGHVLDALTGPVGFLMTMTGNQRMATGVEIVSTSLQIGLLTTLIPAYGIEGAAVGIALTTVFRNLAMLFMLWRITGIRSTLF
jgi:O-antigen/teichoic acid export membrane protein